MPPVVSNHKKLKGLDEGLLIGIALSNVQKTFYTINQEFSR